jgi:hypothetical protein
VPRRTFRSKLKAVARVRATALICAALLLVAACDEAPTTPSADVSGDWDFTFSAVDQRSCAVDSALRQGCAGGGRLEFLATTPITATHSYRASCQSCERAADFGVFEQPLRTARLTGDVLEFTLAACRFTAAIPAAPAQTLVGTVVCRPNQQVDLEVSGDWSMSRQ